MKKALVILFAAFIGGFFVMNLILPDRTYSPLERRNLAGFPVFSIQRVFSGDFEADAEAYVTDQFAMRDAWTALKAEAERLAGKRENNGVYIVGDTLIERIDDPDEDRLAANIRAVNRFAENAGVPVFLTILPTAAYVWRDRLPVGAPTADEDAIISRVAAETKAVYFDTLIALDSHSDEAVFYRTDHHWTTLGAYYASCALLEALSFKASDAAAFSPEAVCDDFYGTLYAKAGLRDILPDTIEKWVADDGNYGLYDDDQLAGDDKYAYFMGGNQPLAVIQTGHEGPRLLLVRDSYADSEVPFLLGAFSEIHMADLRYYKDGLVDYIAGNGIDCVVISYSVRIFIADTNLHFLL